MSDYISPFAQNFPEMPAINGVKLAVAHTGMRYKNRDDVMLAVFDEGTSCAGIYTKNTIPGHPVTWNRSILSRGIARALIVNAGVANVSTGPSGWQATIETTEAVANIVGCDKEDVHIASTGVIGEHLDASAIVNILPTMQNNLSDISWEVSAKAIMTTDTFAKGVTRTATIGNTIVTLNGFIKGSGMIAPDMATMLGYVFTDAKIPAEILQQLLNQVKDVSYNAITVDSDTSTSDTIEVFATGKADHWEINAATDPHFADFVEKFYEIHQELAKLVVKDGEGITKFITVNITGAKNDAQAHKAALSVANSPLVKCAVAGEDPNWGRITMAVGKSGAQTSPETISVSIGNIAVFEKGALRDDYKEEDAVEHMRQKEVTLSADLGAGNGKATVWTIDLSYEYIRINVDYRS